MSQITYNEKGLSNDPAFIRNNFADNNLEILFS